MPTGKLFRKTANVRQLNKRSQSVQGSNNPDTGVLDGGGSGLIMTPVNPDAGGRMQLAVPQIQSQLTAVIGGLETIFKTYEKYFGSIGTTLKDDIEAKIKYIEGKIETFINKDIEGKIETFENAMENSEKKCAASAKAAAISATDAASSAKEVATSAKAAADSAKEAKDAENSSRVYKNSTETMEDAVKKMEEKIEQIYKEILAIEKNLKPEPEKFPESIYITTESELPKDSKEENIYNAIKEDGKIRIYNGFPIYQQKVNMNNTVPRLVYVFKAPEGFTAQTATGLDVNMPKGSLVWNWQSIDLKKIGNLFPNYSYLYKKFNPTLNDFLKAQNLFQIQESSAYYRSFSLSVESNSDPSVGSLGGKRIPGN